MGDFGSRRGIKEILQAAEGVALPVGIIQRGRAERIRIAHPVKSKGAARIRLLAIGIAVVKELGGHNPFVVPDGSVIIQAAGQAERSAAVPVVLTAVLIQRTAAKQVAGHTGAAVGIAESQNVSAGAPVALTIQAGAVIALTINPGNPGAPAAIRILSAGNIVIVKCRPVIVIPGAGIRDQANYRAVAD